MLSQRNATGPFYPLRSSGRWGWKLHDHLVVDDAGLPIAVWLCHFAEAKPLVKLNRTNIVAVYTKTEIAISVSVFLSFSLQVTQNQNGESFVLSRIFRLVLESGIYGDPRNHADFFEFALVRRYSPFSWADRSEADKVPLLSSVQPYLRIVASDSARVRSLASRRDGP